jgi:hypothetical protein
MNGTASPPPGEGKSREDAARRLLNRLDRRARLNTGIGILQVQDACGKQEASDKLCLGHDLAGQDALAARTIAAADADADNRADPDPGWD